MRALISVVALSTLAGAALAGPFVPGAALVDPGLSGNTQYDGWIGLTNANYPGYGNFPGSGNWPGTIGSNRTAANTFNASEAGDATLAKAANGAGGGPFVGSSSVYFGGFLTSPNNLGGQIAFADATPVANLKTVTFQLQIAEAIGYDLYNRAFPVLSYNGGSQNLAGVFNQRIERFDNGTFQSPIGPDTLWINTYFIQFDLSGVVDPITDFKVSVTGAMHAQVYGARLDQSDVFTAVPTPGALSVLGLTGLVAGRRRR
jgi:hypothetical protein